MTAWVGRVEPSVRGAYGCRERLPSQQHMGELMGKQGSLRIGDTYQRIPRSNRRLQVTRFSRVQIYSTECGYLCLPLTFAPQVIPVPSEFYVR